jgi:hypothetical protein
MLALLAQSSALSAGSTVRTLLGTGAAGYSDLQVNNPYGLTFGPDGLLYFCDLDNQRIPPTRSPGSSDRHRRR